MQPIDDTTFHPFTRELPYLPEIAGGRIDLRDGSYERYFQAGMEYSDGERLFPGSRMHHSYKIAGDSVVFTEDDTLILHVGFLGAELGCPQNHEQVWDNRILYQGVQGNGSANCTGLVYDSLSRLDTPHRDTTVIRRFRFAVGKDSEALVLGKTCITRMEYRDSTHFGIVPFADCKAAKERLRTSAPPSQAISILVADLASLWVRQSKP